MAERFFDRPGVAFTWVAVELIAFLILIGVATLWIPHVERIFRAEGIALSNAAAGCIAVGRSMGAYAWLLIPLVLLSLFVKAGIVHPQPAQARMVSLSAVAIALLFLATAMFLVACLTLELNKPATFTSGKDL